jgi:hypothetical protein
VCFVADAARGSVRGQIAAPISGSRSVRPEYFRTSRPGPAVRPQSPLKHTDNARATQTPSRPRRPPQLPHGPTHPSSNDRPGPIGPTPARGRIRDEQERASRCPIDRPQKARSAARGNRGARRHARRAGASKSVPKWSRCRERQPRPEATAAPPQWRRVKRGAARTRQRSALGERERANRCPSGRVAGARTAARGGGQRRGSGGAWSGRSGAADVGGEAAAAVTADEAVWRCVGLRAGSVGEAVAA